MTLCASDVETVERRFLVTEQSPGADLSCEGPLACYAAVREFDRFEAKTNRNPMADASRPNASALRGGADRSSVGPADSAVKPMSVSGHKEKTQVPSFCS